MTHAALKDHLESLRALAAVIRKHGTCAPAAIELVADRIAALSAMEGEGVAWGAYRLSMGRYTATSDNRAYIERVYGDDADYRIDALYTAPPPQQAVGNVWRGKVDLLCASDAVVVDGLENPQALLKQIVEIRLATHPTPSPGPQGGGDAQTIAVSDLARLLEVKGATVIRSLMTFGVMATLNQRIDFDTAELVVKDMKTATPPAHQPGEVGEGELAAAVAHQVNALRALAAAMRNRGPCAPGAIEQVADYLAAALAPKEAGHG